VVKFGMEKMNRSITVSKLSDKAIEKLRIK